QCGQAASEKRVDSTLVTLSTPLDVNTELKRLPNADLNMCFAFLTMLLNENFFNNTAWDKLIKDGTVNAVLDRITEIIQH
ncbi:MAG: hypothetical protein RR234_10985, partial [Christensenella sp.]